MAAGSSGTPGLLRLFNSQLGGQIAWFLPLSVVGLVAGLVIRFRAPRTDLARAAFLLWGGWLAVTRHRLQLHVRGHPQLLRGGHGPGGRRARRRRRGCDVAGARASPVGRGGARPGAGGLRGRGAHAARPDPVLRARARARRPRGHRGHGPAGRPPARGFPGRVQVAAASLAIAMLLAGPAAYAVDTMQTAYSGGDPSAGPQASGTDGGRGAFAGGWPAGWPVDRRRAPVARWASRRWVHPAGPA